jgi:hypothetical protein
VNAFTPAFFDQYLQDRPPGRLDGLARRYPEVIFTSRH